MTEQEYNKLISEIDKSFKHITKDNLSEYEKGLVDFVESSNMTYEELQDKLTKDSSKNYDLLQHPLDAIENYLDKQNVVQAKKAYDDQKESLENSINRLHIEEARTKEAKDASDKINAQIEDIKKNQAEVIEGYRKDRNQKIENETYALKQDIDSKSKKVPTVQAELDEINKKINDLNSDTANKKSIISSYDETIQNEQKSINDNNAKIPSYNKRIETADNEIKELMKRKAKLEEKFKKRDSLRGTINKCEKDIQTYEANIKQILVQIDETLKNNNGNTNDPLYKEQFEKMNLESLKHASTKELQSRSAEEIELLDAEYNGDRFIYEKTDIDIKTKESLKDDLTNKINQINKAIEESKKKIEDTKKEKEEFKKNIDKASKTLKEYDNKKKDLSNEINSLNSDIKVQTEKLDNLTSIVTKEADEEFKLKESAIKGSTENDIKALAPSLKEAEEKYNECLMQENGTKDEVKREEAFESTCEQKLKAEITSELKKSNSEINKKINKCSYYSSIKEIMDNSKDKHVKTDKGVIEGLACVKRAYLNYKNNNGPFSRFFKFLPWTKANKEYKLFDSVRSHYSEISGVSKDEVNNFLDNNRLSDNLRNSRNALKAGEYDKIMNQGVYYNPITFKKCEGITNEQYSDAIRKQFDEERIVSEFLFKADYDKRGFKNLSKTEKIIEELRKEKTEKNTKLIKDLIKYAGEIAPSGMKNEVVEYLSSYSEGKNRPLNVPNDLMDVYKNVKKEEESIIVKDENAVLENKSSLSIKDEVYEHSRLYQEEHNKDSSKDEIIAYQQMEDNYVDNENPDLSNLEDDVDFNKNAPEDEKQEEFDEENKNANKDLEADEEQYIKDDFQ